MKMVIVFIILFLPEGILGYLKIGRTGDRVLSTADVQDVNTEKVADV